MNKLIPVPKRKGNKLQCNRCGKYYELIHYDYDSELERHNNLCGHCFDDELRLRKKICKNCETDPKRPLFVPDISDEERICRYCVRF